MSSRNPEPTIHQAEWRERRNRLVSALALLLAGTVLMGAWIGLFGFLTTNPAADAYDWLDDEFIPNTNPGGIPELPNLSRTSNLFSADGVQLAELSLRGSLPVSISEIPEYVSGAILAAEDGDFYDHRGADLYPEWIHHHPAGGAQPRHCWAGEDGSAQAGRDRLGRRNGT